MRRCKRAGYGPLQSSGSLRFVGGSQARLNALIDLFAMHGDVFRGIDADPDLLAANAQNGDRDVVTNVYAFTDFAGEYQHGVLLDYFIRAPDSDSADVGTAYRLVLSVTMWVPLSDVQMQH
ncbi:protein of unknown function [Pseudomonas mediterranea]